MAPSHSRTLPTARPGWSAHARRDISGNRSLQQSVARESAATLLPRSGSELRRVALRTTSPPGESSDPRPATRRGAVWTTVGATRCWNTQQLLWAMYWDEWDPSLIRTALFMAWLRYYESKRAARQVVSPALFLRGLRMVEREAREGEVYCDPRVQPRPARDVRTVTYIYPPSSPTSPLARTPAPVDDADVGQKGRNDLRGAPARAAVEPATVAPGRSTF